MRFFAVLLWAAFSCQGAEIRQLAWPTKLGSPTPELSGEASRLLPSFQLATLTLPESTLIDLALSQPDILGLSAGEAATLRPLAAARYRKIESSELFSSVPSMLPYSYAAQKPETGTAALYLPDDPARAEGVIVFLHGYGGSFLWYLHLLAEAFPKHIILCPAYGISPALIPAPYVLEAIDAASKEIGRSLGKPVLIGLSAGGAGACRVYASVPQKFSQIICLGSPPPHDTFAIFPKEGTASFLAGGNEFFAQPKDSAEWLSQLRLRSPRVQFTTIPQADHFFLLTHREKTVEILRHWLNVPAASAQPAMEP